MLNSLPKINSARLNVGNYSSGRGSFCPNCRHEYLNKFGLVRWFISPKEQPLIGWSDAPFAHQNDVAAVFECANCFEIYWFHLNLDYIKELWAEIKE